MLHLFKDTLVLRRYKEKIKKPNTRQDSNPRRYKATQIYRCALDIKYKPKNSFNTFFSNKAFH